MNYKMILSTIGKMFVSLSALLILPMIVAIVYKETCIAAFLLTAVISFVLGIILSMVFKTKNHIIYAREGFVIVAAVWLIFSLFGAMPFVLSGEIPNFVDAFFETVSGFTTTGASILTDVEAMSKSLLFWRSFTHWIGGMGVLVFVLALIPNISDRSIHLLRAEVPGPVVGKLVPRIRQTARILYIIYIVLTIIEITFLLLGKMSLFDSLVHAFGTAGTGGFGIKGDSIGGYSPYLQWVIAIFMLVFGVNFNIYYLILIKKAKHIIKSEELWIYVGLIVLSTGFIAVNVFSQYGNFGETLRHSLFQVSSIITTTGYSTADFNLWPTFSKAVLFLLMFIGGCAGSTAGGLKVSRVILLFKKISREIRHTLHPRSVNSIKLEGKQVSENTISSVGTYFAVYSFILIGTFLIISLDSFGFETNFSATVACFNNVGPGFASVGPIASYAEYSALSKIVLSFAMLFGRLEIYPLLIFFMPKLWRRD